MSYRDLTDEYLHEVCMCFTPPESIDKCKDILNDVSKHWKMFKYMPDVFRSNKKFTIAVVRANSLALFVVKSNFLTDPEIISAALCETSCNIQAIPYYTYDYPHVLTYPSVTRYIHKTFADKNWCCKKYYSTILSLRLPHAIIDDLIMIKFKYNEMRRHNQFLNNN